MSRSDSLLLLGVFILLNSSGFLLSVETFQKEVCEVFWDLVETFRELNQDLIFSYGGRW